MARGYTLIELMVVLAVVGILAIAAMSGLYSFMGTKSAQVELIKLKSVLELAKNKAISKAESVTVCPSTSGKSCNSKNWNNEIIVFVDQNKDEKLLDSDVLLTTLPPLRGNKKLVGRGFGSPKYIQFSPDGLMNGFNGTFVFCIGSGSKLIAQGLIVAQTGRMRFTEGNAKVHIGTNGEPLEC